LFIVDYLVISKTDHKLLLNNNITNKNKLKVVAFYSDLKNEIVLDPSTFINQNLDNSKKYGLEVQNEFKFNEKTSAKVLYNFIKAKIGSDPNSKYIKGNDLPGVSKHALVVNLNHKFSEQGAINITHSWKDESYAINDWANVGILKTPFYNSTDLNVNYDIKNQDYFNNVSVFGGIQNIFEHKNAQTVKGSSTTAYYAYNYKRTWVTGVKIDF
jgi:iron complex outermembrane receptor protein